MRAEKPHLSPWLGAVLIKEQAKIYNSRVHTRLCCNAHNLGEIEDGFEVRPVFKGFLNCC